MNDDGEESNVEEEVEVSDLATRLRRKYLKSSIGNCFLKKARIIRDLQDSTRKKTTYALEKKEKKKIRKRARILLEREHNKVNQDITEEKKSIEPTKVLKPVVGTDPWQLSKRKKVVRTEP
eukprot:g2764.t1